MNEFDVSNYDDARNFAKAIQQNANNINDIFNNMTDTMNKLGEDWKSEGATEVQNMYNTIKAKYPVFYERILADTNHILKVVEADIAADTEANKVVDNAG